MSEIDKPLSAIAQAVMSVALLPLCLLTIAIWLGVSRIFNPATRPG